MRFPARLHHPNGGFSTVYIVRKSGVDPELLYDREGNCYVPRNGRSGIETYEPPTAPTAPTADPPPGMEPTERDELTAFLRARRGGGPRADAELLYEPRGGE